MSVFGSRKSADSIPDVDPVSLKDLCTLLRVPTINKYSFTAYYDEDKLLTTQEVGIIAATLKNIDVVAAKHHSGGYVNTTPFWTAFYTGGFRTDAMDVLFNNFFDPHNKVLQQKLLTIFCRTLEHGGCEFINGQTKRIKMALEKMWGFMVSHFPTAIIDYRSENGGSLMHYAFYGNAVSVRKLYARRILELYQHMSNGQYLPFYTDKPLSNGIVCGQSIVFLIARYGVNDILKQILKHTNPKELFAYDGWHTDGNTVFLPLVHHLLVSIAWYKYLPNVDLIAESIQIILESMSEDDRHRLVTLPFYYDNPVQEVSYSLYDFLDYFGYVYSGSAVYDVLKPYCNDIEHNNAVPRRGSAPVNDGANQRLASITLAQLFYEECYSDNDYDRVWHKHRYTKDPTRYKEVVADLEQVRDSHDGKMPKRDPWYGESEEIDAFFQPIIETTIILIDGEKREFKVIKRAGVRGCEIDEGFVSLKELKKRYTIFFR